MFETGNFLFQVAIFAAQGGDLGSRVISIALHHFAHSRQALLGLVHQGQSTAARNAFNTPYTGSDPGFGHDAHKPDVAGTADMGAAAQFH